MLHVHGAHDPQTREAPLGGGIRAPLLMGLKGVNVGARAKLRWAVWAALVCVLALPVAMPGAAIALEPDRRSMAP
jgi:hypothetical protein